MKKRLTLLLPFLVAALGQDARAWSPKDHRMIVALAIEHCPAGLASFLRDHLAEVERGSVDPDRKFMDTANHTYNLEDGTRNNPDHVAHVSSALVSMVRNKAPREDVAYWFGALSHYVSDIDQPLHASDRDKRESWYHLLFEGLDYGFESHKQVLGIEIDVKVGKALSGWQFQYDGRRDELVHCRTIEDIRQWQLENAKWANGYYDEIAGIYAKKGALHTGRLEEIYRTCLDEAVDDVIDLWAHVYRSADEDLAGLPSRNDVLRIDVDKKGRIRLDGKSVGKQKLPEALESYLSALKRDEKRAPLSAFLEIDNRCDERLEERFREICAGAGIGRFSAIRAQKGPWTSRLYRAVKVHVASLTDAKGS
jgi:hypothetical protein